jgi:hypothetical protein
MRHLGVHKLQQDHSGRGGWLRERLRCLRHSKAVIVYTNATSIRPPKPI